MIISRYTQNFILVLQYPGFKNEQMMKSVMTERLTSSSAIPFEFSVQLIDIAIVVMDLRVHTARERNDDTSAYIISIFTRSPAHSGQFPTVFPQSPSRRLLNSANRLRVASAFAQVFNLRRFRKMFLRGIYMYATPSVFQPRTRSFEDDSGILETIRHRNVVDYIADLTSLDLSTGAAR